MDALRSRSRIAGVVLTALMISGTGRADLPPLIPRDVLFGAPAKAAPKLSPDGTRLSYLASGESGVLNLWVRTIGKNDDRQITHDERRGVFFYAWAPGGEQLLYLQDRDGDENWHLYMTPLAGGETRDLTPYPGMRAGNLLVDPAHPGHVLVSLNKRDPRVSDMYRIDLESGALTLAAENPGDVIEWVTDHNFVIRAAAAIDAQARAVIRVRDADGQPWRDLQSWDFEEAGFDRFQRIVAFSPDGKRLVLQSARGSNTTRLVEVELATGRESEIIAADPRCDLWNTMDFSLEYSPVAVMLDPETKAVQAYALYPMKPEWHVVDPALANDFETLAAQSGAFFVVDRSKDDSRWLVHFESDTVPSAHYVYDRHARSIELLFADAPALAEFRFAPMEPIRYRARDGLEISAYLTLPLGVEPRSLPIVVLPHGGPWHRDEWGLNAEVQWLANRGYAVLQPQFRGSTGFGKAFLTASNGEMGVGHMQHDISDAVRWAIDRGIADPTRIGIMGGSYGGYATLAGITFSPNLYACAVDLFGVSNMKTSFEAFPPYWGPRIKRWLNRVGNVLEDDALNRRISPIFHVDKIRAPLLIGHGANDVRVRIEESDRIVAAMRASGLEVTYVVYPDEGHGFARPPNASDFSGRVEEFLAKHLGGRKEPWKKLDGSTAELR